MAVVITVQTLAANDGLEHLPIDDPIVSRAKVAHQFEKKLSSTLTQRTVNDAMFDQNSYQR